MGIIQLIVERPGLERTISARDFETPIRMLNAEHRYLRRILESLARLADDLHLADRARIAGSILDYISLELNWLSADHEDLVAALEQRSRPGMDRRIGAVSDAVRKEHAAMRRLVPHVIQGLHVISADDVPARPRAFALSALVFCEFVRLHTDYEDAVLLPLAQGALTKIELDDLAVDMAFRRGMSAL